MLVVVTVEIQLPHCKKSFLNKGVLFGVGVVLGLNAGSKHDKYDNTLTGDVATTGGVHHIDVVPVTEASRHVSLGVSAAIARCCSTAYEHTIRHRLRSCPDNLNTTRGFLKYPTASRQHLKQIMEGRQRRGGGE